MYSTPPFVGHSRNFAWIFSTGILEWLGYHMLLHSSQTAPRRQTLCHYRPVLLLLMQSLILTRFDYGNATLAGLSVRLTARLQSVLHAAARLIYSKRKYEHITPLLMELHWLSVPERIQFKLAVLVFRCLYGTAPPYLADQVQPVAALESRTRLGSSASARLDIPRARRTCRRSS